MKKAGRIGESERGNPSRTPRPPHRCVQVLAGEPAAGIPVRKGRGRVKRDGDITANKAPHPKFIPDLLPKLGEPHGRLQDATSLRIDARRKPSKPGGTAGAERFQAVAGLKRRMGPSSWRPIREWTRADCVDGGEIFGQPQERRPNEVSVERVR
jgi:hypothetical protein